MEMSAAGAQLDHCRDLLPRAIEELQRFRKAVEIDGWVSQADGNSAIEETIYV
jgi:hypothetical protein